MIFFSRQDTAYQSGGGFSPTEPLFCVSSYIFLENLQKKYLYENSLLSYCNFIHLHVVNLNKYVCVIMNLIGFIKHEIAKVVEMVENGAKIACFKLEMRG